MSDATTHDPMLHAFDKNEQFVARFFAVDVQTVRGWRKRKKGPPFRKIGGRLVRYSLAELAEWGDKQKGDSNGQN